MHSRAVVYPFTLLAFLATHYVTLATPLHQPRTPRLLIAARFLAHSRTRPLAPPLSRLPTSARIPAHSTFNHAFPVPFPETNSHPRPTRPKPPAPRIAAPRTFTFCHHSANCEVGEICASLPDTSRTVCILKLVEENLDGFGMVHTMSTDPPVPVESPEIPAASATSGGFTFDPCISSADCRGDRECVKLFEDDGTPCTRGLDFCVCAPPVPIYCVTSFECESGEVCASSFTSIYAICISEQEVQNFDAFFEVGPATSEPPAPMEPAPVPPFGPDECCNNGFTFDTCTSAADCRGDRNCVQVGTVSLTSCTTGASYCLCAPEMLVVCAESSDCEPGEVCASDTISIFSNCLSEEFVQNISGLVKQEPASSDTTTSAEPSPEPTVVLDECCNNGLTLDTCTSSADCRGDRDCLVVEDATAMLCTPRSIFCVCAPSELVSCEDSSVCEAGEVCAMLPAVPPFCISEEVVEEDEVLEEVAPSSAGAPTNEPLPTGAPTNEPLPTGAPTNELLPTGAPTDDPPATDDASPICIDAEALAHVPRERLVFKEHAIGRVLCDRAGSCATGGHMVVFRGQAMMMRSYCELVKCERREIYVNSPRYRRGTRVKSKTEGLEYTAFAARWETRMEERVLVAAVRVGL